MKRLFYKLLATTLIITSLSCSQNRSTSVDASSKTFHQEISQDVYQKAITKGFLGRSYGVGNGRYVCNTYVGTALENVSTTLEQKDTAFKNVKITKGKKGLPTSLDWKEYNVKISYTESIYDEDSNTYFWNTEDTVTRINKKNKGTSLTSLELGDVLTYGVHGGHVALYFGKYDNMKEVKDRLIELGVFKDSDLKKRGDRYVNKKGKTVLREYTGSGSYWRVHATNSGLLIDNAIRSKRSNGTSSFGKWTKAIPSGYSVAGDSLT